MVIITLNCFFFNGMQTSLDPCFMIKSKMEGQLEEGFKSFKTALWVFLNMLMMNCVKSRILSEKGPNQIPYWWEIFPPLTKYALEHNDNS